MCIYYNNEFNNINNYKDAAMKNYENRFVVSKAIVDAYPLISKLIQVAGVPIGASAYSHPITRMTIFNFDVHIFTTRIMSKHKCKVVFNEYETTRAKFIHFIKYIDNNQIEERTFELVGNDIKEYKEEVSYVPLINPEMVYDKKEREKEKKKIRRQEREAIQQQLNKKKELLNILESIYPSREELLSYADLIDNSWKKTVNKYINLGTRSFSEGSQNNHSPIRPSYSGLRYELHFPEDIPKQDFINRILYQREKQYHNHFYYR